MRGLRTHVVLLALAVVMAVSSAAGERQRGVARRLAEAVRRLPQDWAAGWSGSRTGSARRSSAAVGASPLSGQIVSAYPRQGSWS